MSNDNIPNVAADGIGKMASNIDAGMREIEAQVQQARGAVGEVRARIHALEGESERLRDSPVCRKHFIAAVECVIRRRAEMYRGRALSFISIGKSRDEQARRGSRYLALDRSFGSGAVSFGNVVDILNDPDRKLISHSPGSDNAFFSLEDPSVLREGEWSLGLLLSLCEDQAVDNMRRALTQGDWPYGEQTPIAERKVRLAEIAREVAGLHEVEAKLQAMIDRAASIQGA